MAYLALHQTTEGSRHVYAGSCAPLLNAILHRISGDWRAPWKSEGGIHLLKKCDSWPELCPYANSLYSFDMNESKEGREIEIEREREIAPRLRQTDRPRERLDGTEGEREMALH